MSEDNITKAKLEEVLEECKDDSGTMVKIPILSSIRVVNGELICEVEGFSTVFNNKSYVN